MNALSLKNIKQWLEQFGDDRNKVYIIPTKLGLFYIGINFATFMIGLVYTNNMALLVAFLLVSFLVVTMVLTNNQLLNTRFINLNVHDFYADQLGVGKLTLSSKSYSPHLSIEFKTLHNQSSRTHNLKLQLSNDQYFFNLKMPRGTYQINRIKIYSESPASLFHAWSSWKTNNQFYVYPHPKSVEYTPQLNAKDSPMPQEESDFSYRIIYQRGMSSKRIDWKTYAKSDTLLWKKYDVMTPDFFDFELEKIPGSLEEQLQHLSFLINIAHSQNAMWSLKIAQENLEGKGGDFFKLCMQKLAGV